MIGYDPENENRKVHIQFIVTTLIALVVVGLIIYNLPK